MSFKDLQDTLRGAHDEHWDRHAQEAARKTIVLVEGDDDALVLRAALTARRPNWPNFVAVIPMGGRKEVLAALTTGTLKGKATSPNLYGLVDRDTWTDAEANARRAATADRLYVTPGWCIENQFFDPTVLRSLAEVVLPDSAQVDAAVATLTAALEAERSRWVRAGALWRALQRPREALNEALDPIFRLGYGSVPPFALDEATLRHELTHRLAAFDPTSLGVDAVVTEVTARIRATQAMAPAVQWQAAVHGKSAFSELLLPHFQQILRSQRTKDQWLTELGGCLHRVPPWAELIALVLP